ncbi:hypothetical protein HDV00_011684 [Rhizophlyctis rosea]|nr:hypothetical protein HDV00_011684 [Rhizophlyctis rosea]
MIGTLLWCLGLAVLALVTISPDLITVAVGTILGLLGAGIPDGGVANAASIFPIRLFIHFHVIILYLLRRRMGRFYDFINDSLTFLFALSFLLRPANLAWFYLSYIYRPYRDLQLNPYPIIFNHLIQEIGIARFIAPGNPASRIYLTPGSKGHRTLAIISISVITLPDTLLPLWFSRSSLLSKLIWSTAEYVLFFYVMDLFGYAFWPRIDVPDPGQLGLHSVHDPPGHLRTLGHQGRTILPRTGLGVGRISNLSVGKNGVDLLWVRCVYGPTLVVIYNT